MGLKDEIASEVAKIFREPWDERNGEQVPDPEDVALGNEAVLLDAVVLYADLADSTAMVDTEPAQFAAEVYKAYLISACRTIRANGGEIVSFDGDRVMAVYIGKAKCTSAALTALQINFVVRKIVNPKLKEQYPLSDYEVRQVVGVDRSQLMVARTGIRNNNDLVWVGRAANHAAKMSNFGPAAGRSWITSEVYGPMRDKYKWYDGKSVWKKQTWEEMDRQVYSSNWTWGFEDS